jgi:hypothetical protein
MKKGLLIKESGMQKEVAGRLALNYLQYHQIVLVLVLLLALETDRFTITRTRTIRKRKGGEDR